MQPFIRRVCQLGAATTAAACGSTRDHEATNAVVLCGPPTDTVRPRPSVEELQRLAGRFALTVVATQGYVGDTIVRGALELWVPDSAHAAVRPNPQLPNHVVRFPLNGMTDVALDALAPVSLAYSPSSRDPDQPGVQMLDDATLWVGGSMGPRYVTMDAGVLFEVYALDRIGFRGRWVEGGRRMVNGKLPAGYFCAVRAAT